MSEQWIDQVTDVDVADPFSSNTRKERTSLLAANIVLFAVAQARLIPTEIDAFGIRASQFNGTALVTLLYLIILYLSLAFGIYAAADLRAWRTRLTILRDRKTRRGERSLDQLRKDCREALMKKYGDRLHPAEIAQLSDSSVDNVWSAVKSGLDSSWARFTRAYRVRMAFDVAAPFAITVANLVLSWTVLR
jgi:hypothetical protein